MTRGSAGSRGISNEGALLDKISERLRGEYKLVLFQAGKYVLSLNLTLYFSLQKLDRLLPHSCSVLMKYAKKNSIRSLAGDMAAFSRARVVIGPHGGAFLNMIFLPSGV